MRLLKSIFLTFALMMPISAAAQGNVVVELFTSQGCSSCPPADKLLRELATEDSIIVLGWHVDYWDYLGWKDKFSRPENTARQDGYRQRWNMRTLYTPQMVIHGETQIVGSNEHEVRMYTKQFMAEEPMLEISTSVAGDKANIQVQPHGSKLPAADIFLVRINPEATTPIQRGENAGKTIAYINIVEDITRISGWDGHSIVDVSASIDGDARYVVLVQAEDFGPIFGAEYLD